MRAPGRAIAKGKFFYIKFLKKIFKKGWKNIFIKNIFIKF